MWCCMVMWCGGVCCAVRVQQRENMNININEHVCVRVCERERERERESACERVCVVGCCVVLWCGGSVWKGVRWWCCMVFVVVVYVLQ